MPLPSSINRQALIRRLRKLGFTGPEMGKGDHPEFMRRGERTVKLPNKHKRKDIGRNLLRKVLTQAGITEDEWTGGSDDDEGPTDDQ